jgi:hypothetical protein
MTGPLESCAREKAYDDAETVWTKARKAAV